MRREKMLQSSAAILTVTKGLGDQPRVSMTGMSPDFLCIGAQKAATSWLFKQLAMHRDIYFPRGKEVHYWDQPRDKRAPLASYLQPFNSGVAKSLGGLSGDMTPAYLLAADADIRDIRRALPEVRLLVMVRSPVERAISAARMYFESRPKPTDSEFHAVLFRRFTINCGDYILHIRRWLDHFPREQLHVIVQDDIKTNARAVVERAAEHIGADPRFYDFIKDEAFSHKVLSAKILHPVAEVDRRKLADTYRAGVVDLSEFLGRDLTHWTE